VVEWVEEQVGADGQLTAEVHQYTELATGLHYWDEEAGQWLESVEAFELLPQGYAVARRGQHKVLLAGNINQGGSVDLELPDGSRMLSNPMGLSYFDASSGRNVLLAEVKDCAGVQVAPNMILFPDAFDTLKAALRYTYSLGGFESDVILLEDPGAPELYGLDRAWTTLEVYTEFFEAPEPEVRFGTEQEVTWSTRRWGMGKPPSLAAVGTGRGGDRPGSRGGSGAGFWVDADGTGHGLPPASGGGKRCDDQGVGTIGWAAVLDRTDCLRAGGAPARKAPHAHLLA
jgi:hypothetical protein